jgi:PAS domain-containing protein
VPDRPRIVHDLGRCTVAQAIMVEGGGVSTVEPGAAEVDSDQGLASDPVTAGLAGARPGLDALVLDAAGHAVIAADAHGRILFWNRFAQHLYGWSAQEVIGRPVTEVVPAGTGAARWRPRAKTDPRSWRCTPTARCWTTVRSWVW